MNITIKDVAKAANVSVATVSRVLNKKSNVSDEAVQAVNKAVEDLGYSPNFLGRDLRKSETKRILAIIASTEQSFYSEVLRGMQDAAYMQGYDVLIATTRDDPEHEMHLLGMLFQRRWTEPCCSRRSSTAALSRSLRRSTSLRCALSASRTAIYCA